MKKRTKLEKIPPSYRKEVERQLNSLSDAIQAKRETKGLTQEELAEELGITTIALQFIEQKRRNPSLPMLVYICMVLDLKVHLG